MLNKSPPSFIVYIYMYTIHQTHVLPWQQIHIHVRNACHCACTFYMCTNTHLFIEVCCTSPPTIYHKCCVYIDMHCIYLLYNKLILSNKLKYTYTVTAAHVCLHRNHCDLGEWATTMKVSLPALRLCTLTKVPLVLVGCVGVTQPKDSADPFHTLSLALSASYIHFSSFSVMRMVLLFCSVVRRLSWVFRGSGKSLDGFANG